MAVVESIPFAWRDQDHNGLNGIFDVSLTQEQLQQSTVNDLIHLLNERVPQQSTSMKRYVRHLELYGEKVEGSEKLDSLMPQLSSASPRLVVATRFLRVNHVFITIRYSWMSRVTTMECNVHDKIQDLKQRILQTEGIPKEHQRLIFNDKELEDNQPLIAYGFTVDNDHALELLYMSRVGSKIITVLVRTLTGETIPFQIDVCRSVLDLQLRIQEMRGIRLEDQRCLMFDNTRMEDTRTLADYGIEHESTLLLVLRIRGGGSVSCGALFADVSNESLLEFREFSSSAPVWRVVGIGLNVEGRCENQQCEASQKLVIQRRGFTPFNLITDRIACPMCSQPVTPITCGFYNCTWKYEGVRSLDKCIMSSPWKVAEGKRYHRFNTHEPHGTAAWEGLVIVAKSTIFTKQAKLVAEGIPSSEPAATNTDEVCSICWGELGSSRTLQASCPHRFHSNCFTQWAGFCRREYKSMTCPLCRAAIQAMD